jgi:tetratricopeptide (TPR) repeat protein
MKALEARASLVEGRAYLQLGRSSEALPVLQRSVELRQSTVAPISPVLALAQIVLGECYLDLGNRDQGQTMAVAAQKSLATHKQLSGVYLHPLQELEKRLRDASSTHRG